MADEQQKPQVVIVKRSPGCFVWGAGIVATLVIVGTLLPKPAPDPAKDPASLIASAAAVKVVPEDLRAAYAANEVSAQQRYGARTLEVTGKIHDITLDLTDDPVLQFRTAKDYDTVHASFGKEAAGAVGALAKGQTVTVRCLKVSEVMGTPMLSDCVLVHAAAK